MNAKIIVSLKDATFQVKHLPDQRRLVGQKNHTEK